MITTIPGTLCAFLLPFAKHFRNQGWRVDAMAHGISNNIECLQAFDQTWDINWSRNPLAFQNLVIAPHIIQNVVVQGQYDIVHVHTPVAAFVTRYALKNYHNQLKPKIIYTAHGFPFHPRGSKLRNAAFQILERLAGNWTDYMIVMNRADEAAAKKHQLISPERLQYMPGIGLDLHYYNPKTISSAAIEQVRKELALPNDTQLILSVAELIPRKRPQDVLTAFARLAHNNVCLAFAGEGQLFKPMQELAAQLKVQDKVRFLGHRRDIPTLMRASCVLILASEYEGLPRCVLEAMCLETPVIGTATRGTQDLLIEGCGKLVEVKSIKELTDAIAWVLDNPESVIKMSKRARKRIANYDLSHVISLHEELYAKALGKEATCVTR